MTVTGRMSECRTTGLSNGDATSLEPFQAMRCKAFSGMCLVIVQSIQGQTGKISLAACAENLSKNEITIRRI